MAKRKNDLTSEKLTKLLNYTLLYSAFKGIFIVFSEDSIDFEANLIEGYYYNPEGTEYNKWAKGIFPIPKAIYRRVSLNKRTTEKLKQITDNGLFNSNYFNKWEFWRLCSGFNMIRNYLPYTKKLTSFENIDELLMKYDSLYIKPIEGSLGKGILKVSKFKGKYIFYNIYDNNKYLVINFKEQVKEYINKIKSKRNYIVQQAINSLKINENLINIRVIMQKTKMMKWQCTGFITFIGKTGRSVSDNQPKGEKLTFETVMKKVGLGEKTIMQKKYEVIRRCLEFCEFLDATGDNYGDLGIDVIIDTNLRIWIIEINKRHNHRIPLAIGDEIMYYFVKNNPIKYAVALSGF